MSPVRVNYWAEGPTDRFVARRIIAAAGGEPGDDYSARLRAAPGKDYLDAQLARFNAAARHAPWLVLRDGDGDCAVAVVTRLLPGPADYMRLRIINPAVEAWLMADREAFAGFLGVSVARVTADPESVIDVKREVVAIASHSRSRAIRDALCPDPRSGRRVGPEYATYLIEFVQNHWTVERARVGSQSLDRALRRVTELTNSA